MKKITTVRLLQDVNRRVRPYFMAKGDLSVVIEEAIEAIYTDPEAIPILKLTGRPKAGAARPVLATATTIAITQESFDRLEELKETLNASKNEIVNTGVLWWLEHGSHVFEEIKK